MWKRYILLLCSLYALGASAQSIADGGARVTDIAVDKQAETVSVSLMLDVSSLRIKGSGILALTPILKGPGHSLELPSVEIMGGKQYIYYLRNKKTGSTEIYRRQPNDKQFIPYKASFPYESWMDNALLYMADSRKGCCTTLISHETLLSDHLALGPQMPPSPEKKAFTPKYTYVTPEYSDNAGVKIRSLKGNAYIGFPVNRWEILDNFRNNTSELYKIYQTIEQARSSDDYQIKAIYLTGFASPESSWTHNEMLARNRTEALKSYLSRRLSISPVIIHTDYVAEDWAGLRAFVENSYIARKDDILSLIDSRLDPDTKEAILKRDYPSQYNYLVQECFPLLRHTDYVIEYQVKNYQDRQQLERVFRENPSDLSLQELYLLAANYSEGSERFKMVFEMAARLYPDDAVSNLNAGLAAIVSSNYILAADYLSKAGNSPEAMNARGILAYYTNEIDKARKFFSDAAARGLQAAAQNAQSIINH